MEEEEKEEVDKAIWSFGCWIVSGFVLIITPGPNEMNWAFAILCWYAGFLHLLRFRYRKYEYGIWAEEIMENLSLVLFVIPAYLLAVIFWEDPIRFLIMCLAGVVGMSLWFVLWRLFIEDLIHGFWW